MNLGAPEVVVILLVALLVFGPQKLPEVARQVGGAMRQLRQMQDTVKSELRTVMAEEEQQPRYSDRQRPPDTPPAPPAPATPALQEPDHTDAPLPPTEPDFNGPDGSFS